VGCDGRRFRFSEASTFLQSIVKLPAPVASHVFDQQIFIDAGRGGYAKTNGGKIVNEIQRILKSRHDFTAS
jgi:hypothetical protein